MLLHAHNGTVTGSVVFGARVGTTRPVRLIADGLATGSASNYSVWLTGPTATS